jgi:hypothetical protein
MKIIFLDIDGVMNCQEGFDPKNKNRIKRVPLDGTERSYSEFYGPSKKLLNDLIETTNAKIVISSTWRNSGIEFMRKVWESEKMSGEVIDITPNLRGLGLGKGLNINIPRGLEIEEWLRVNGYSDIYWSKELQQEYIDKSGIENYLILDDDGDMLWNQREHFVHIPPAPRHLKGFSKRYFNKALSVLSQTSIDINY